MRAEIIDSPKGKLSRCGFDRGERIEKASDFLDCMANCPSDTIVLRKEDLSEDFFRLRTGLAGEMLQKVSNYRKRLVVLGDFRELASGALRDFIYESNATGQVVFAEDLDAALKLLS